MKVIKTIIPIIAIILLCGCSDNKEVEIIDDDYNYDLITFCDKQYGIEYIRDIGVYRGGITIRLDENGNVIHCEKEDDKE